MTQPAALMAALERAGARMTEPRRRVAQLVAERDGHFTAGDIALAAAVRKVRVGRATIFRALELFDELGLVERIDLPTGEHAYLLCDRTHHHHVVCSGCGRSTEVEDCGMAGVALEVARRTGYAIETHRLELFGRCPDCRRTGPDSQ